MSGAKVGAVTRNLYYRPYPRPYGRVGRLSLDADDVIVDAPHVKYAFSGRQDNIIFIQEQIIGADQITIIDSRILYCAESIHGEASCQLYEVHPFTSNPQASYAYMLDQGVYVDNVDALKIGAQDLHSFNILNARYLTAIQQQHQYEEQLKWWQHQQPMLMQQPPAQLFSYQQHVGMPAEQSYSQTSVDLGKEQRELELQRREQEVTAAQENLAQQQSEAAKVIDAEDSQPQGPVIDIVTLLQNAMERYSKAQSAAGELRAIVAQDQVVMPQATAVMLNPVEMCPSSTFSAFINLIAKYNEIMDADDPKGLLIDLIGLCKQDQYISKLDLIEFMSFFDSINPAASLALCLAAINAQYRDGVLTDVDLDLSLIKKINFALLTKVLYLLQNDEELKLELSLTQWQQIMGIANVLKDRTSDYELQIYSRAAVLCSSQIARLTPATKVAPAAKSAVVSAKKSTADAKASKAAKSKKVNRKARKDEDDYDEDFEAAMAEAAQERLAEEGEQEKIAIAAQQDFDRYADMLKSEEGTIAFYKDLADGGKYDLAKNMPRFAGLMHVTNAEGKNLLMLLLESDVMQHSDLYINIGAIARLMGEHYKKTSSEVANKKNIFQHKDNQGQGLLDYCAANVSLEFMEDLPEEKYFAQLRPGLELLIGAYGIYRQVWENLPLEIKQGLNPDVPKKFDLQPAVNFLKTKNGTTFIHTLFSRIDLSNKAHRDYLSNLLKFIFPDDVQTTHGTLALAVLIARNEDGKNLHNVIEDLVARKHEKTLERWLLPIYDRLDLYALDLSRFLSPSIVGGQTASRCVSAVACSTDAVDFFRSHNPTRDPITRLLGSVTGYHDDKDDTPEVISEISSKRAKTRPTGSHNQNSYTIFRDNDHLCNLLDYYCSESPPAVDKAEAYLSNLLRIMQGYTKNPNIIHKSDQKIIKDEVCVQLLGTAINYMFFEKDVNFSQVMSLMDMLMQKSESSEQDRKAIWIGYYRDTLDVYIRTIDEPYKSKALLMMQYLAPKCDLNFIDPDSKQNVMHKIFDRIAAALQHINKKQADQLKGVLVRLLMAIGVVARGDKEKISQLLKDNDAAGKTPLELINDGALRSRVERMLVKQGYANTPPGASLKLKG